MEERKYSAWLQMQPVARRLWPVQRVNFADAFRRGLAAHEARQYPVDEWLNYLGQHQARAMLQREVDAFSQMQRSATSDSPALAQARDRAVRAQRELFNLERIRPDEQYYDSSPRRNRSF